MLCTVVVRRWSGCRGLPGSATLAALQSGRALLGACPGLRIVERAKRSDEAYLPRFDSRGFCSCPSGGSRATCPRGGRSGSIR